MNVIKFELEFKHRKRKFRASCQAFQVRNYPLYRVAVPKGIIDHDIYIFYRVDEEDRKFFWYMLPGMKELIAKSIAGALTEYTSEHYHHFKD